MQLDPKTLEQLIKQHAPRELDQARAINPENVDACLAEASEALRGIGEPSRGGPRRR